jgi:hypothetical protein
MNSQVSAFIAFAKANDGIGDKARFIRAAVERFQFIKDRSVFYSEGFAVRFSSTATGSFSNTVLSLSNLRKYDSAPFIVCLIGPRENRLFLANSTFLVKISHSSHHLTNYNIKGSFNGSDITKELNGIANSPVNFDRLFAIHAELGFEGNLSRLVEATNGIAPTGRKFEVDGARQKVILDSVKRANDFTLSANYTELKRDLDARVAKYESQILVASHIENVNIRGRIIEYLIAGDDEELKGKLVREISEEYGKLPQFKTDNTLGDYQRIFDDTILTETDVKTKVMLLNSNPKGYNIDKLLEFLSQDGTVFLFYFIGIGPDSIVNKILVSVFQEDLLKATLTLKHWAGRNSRGVTQFEGTTLHRIILNPSNSIDVAKAERFLSELIRL